MHALRFSMELFLLLLVSLGRTVAGEWAVSMGGPFIDSPTGVAVDALGNCFVVGSFQGTATIGSTNLYCTGQHDSFLAKFSPDGLFLWARHVSGAGADQAVTSVAADNEGNSYICGRFRGNIQIGTTNLSSTGWYNLFVTKFDTSGALQWVRALGNPGDVHVGQLTVAQDGSLYVAGAFHSSAMFGTIAVVGVADSDAFVVKLDRAGSVLWVRRANGETVDSRSQATSVSAGYDGSILVTGFFGGTSAFETNVFRSAGREDLFLARYSPEGILEWARQGGGGDVDTGESVAVDTQGRCIVAGRFVGSASILGSNLVSSALNDVFIAQVETNGTTSWIRQASAAQTGGLALDAAGNAYLGARYPTRFGDEDLTAYGACVAKYSSNGALQWIRGLDLYCCGPEGIRGVASLGIDSYAIAGAGRINLGTTGVSGDILLARLAPPPPKLTITTAEHLVTVSWPRWAGDFTLESTSSQRISQGWAPVTNATSLSADSYILSTQPVEAQTYFRLRK